MNTIRKWWRRCRGKCEDCGKADKVTYRLCEKCFRVQDRFWTEAIQSAVRGGYRVRWE